MKHFSRMMVTVAGALLVACGGGGSGTASNTPAAAQLDGAIVKGPVSGAAVCAYRLNGGVKGAKLEIQPGSGGSLDAGGCYVTPADGSYSFGVAGYTGEVLLEAAGGRYCTDEAPMQSGACTAGGAVVGLSDPLTAAASVGTSGRATTYVTPLTTAAVSAAAANGGITVETFKGRFVTLAGQVLGNTTVTPATAPTITSHPYLSQVAKFVQQGGSLASAISTLQSGSTTFTQPASGGSGTPATVAAALVGSYDLAFYKGSGAGCGTLCGFAEGQAVKAEVRADGSLMIGSLTLTNPFYRSYGGTPNLHEVIWLDAAAKIEYALSDNATPRFNEINVGNAAAATGGVPAFLGQLRKPQASAASLLQTMVSTLGKGYQYAGTPVAGWTTVSLADTGAVTFSGGTGGPSITAAQVASIGNWTDCCGRLDVRANVDINKDNVVDENDVIRLYRNAKGWLTAVEYYVGNPAAKANLVGVVVGDTPALPAHDGTVPPTSGNVVKGTLNGTAFDLAISNPQRTARQLFFNATNGTVTVQLFMGTSGSFTAGNTYACSVTDTLMVNLGSTAYTKDAGGRCSVTLVEFTAGGAVRGTFVAELGDDRHALQSIVNGVFHID